VCMLMFMIFLLFFFSDVWYWKVVLVILDMN